MSRSSGWSRRRAERLGMLALLGLLGLGMAYLLTAEPAPRVAVRWGDDVSAGRQAELERTYLLLDGIVPYPEFPRSSTYTLQDTSRRNIEALVNDPDIADTHFLDRQRYELTADAEKSERRTWLAHRVPGFRRTAVQRVVIIALAAVAAVALRMYLAAVAVTVLDIARRMPKRMGAFAGTVRRWAKRVGDLPLVRALLSPLKTDSDWFDTFLPRPSAPVSRSHPFSWAAKLIVASAIVVAIGVPILTTWETVLLGVCLLGLVFGDLKPRPWRVAVAVVVALGAVGVKSTLPRADVAEGHHALLLTGDGGPVKRGVPPEVFVSWKARFDALYPPDPARDSDPYQWRKNLPDNVPAVLFTESADAFWRTAKYTRQVDTIGFRSLGEFRGGFANEGRLEGPTQVVLRNFWTGALRRQEIPFYVMYELTPATVGSRLTWQGQVFWYRANGDREEIVHPRPASRTITPEDVGARLYAAFFPAVDRLLFEMEPSRLLRLGAWGDTVVSLIAALAALLLTTRLRWNAYARALVLFSAGYIILMRNIDFRVDHLGPGYFPHQGGDDGLVHDGLGRMMAMILRDGQIGDALRGFESVYWFTPGLRYFRMVEKLIVGDTDLLHTLAVAFVPLVMFYLLRFFLRPVWAWVATAAFCLITVGNFSFLPYINIAKAGYGEPLGGGLFLLGLALVLRTQPSWGGSTRNLALVWVAGAALAASMFIRPNFAVAVVWLGAAYVWSCLRARDVSTAVVFAAGLALALWMPLHNWYYGGELYLISKSGATLSLPIGVRDYVAAFRDAIGGRFDTQAVAVISTQLEGWLWGDPHPEIPWAPAAHAVRLFALAATCWVALRAILGRPSKHHTALGVVAGAALLAHVPMLFVFATFDRYAMLGWDLSLVVLICAYPVEGALFARRGQALSSDRYGIAVDSRP